MPDKAWNVLIDVFDAATDFFLFPLSFRVKTYTFFLRTGIHQMLKIDLGFSSNKDSLGLMVEAKEKGLFSSIPWNKLTSKA
jgi:hypothetical protein